MLVHNDFCISLLIMLFPKVQIADSKHLKCVEILLNSTPEEIFKYVLSTNNLQEYLFIKRLLLDSCYGPKHKLR